jgi:hypothetical protein
MSVYAFPARPAQGKNPPKTTRKPRNRRAPKTSAVVSFPSRPAVPPPVKHLGALFRLSAGPGIEPLDGCSCELCAFLAEPRQDATWLAIFRGSRMAEAASVLLPDVHVFSFDDDDEFDFAEMRLATVAFPDTAYPVRPGMTEEQTIEAAEEQARLAYADRQTVTIEMKSRDGRVETRRVRPAPKVV